MSDKIRVEKLEDGEYQLHLPELGGFKYGISVKATRQELEQIHEAINTQFSEELNDDLAGFLDDDDCEGCKI